MSTKHIEEIDALRGIAVLLVVVYHAYPSLLPGGFIGVDIFFVISGFVISRSFLWPLITQETTLREFYISRLRRLTPALLVIFAFTSVAAYFFALPDRVIAFAWSLLTQLIYSQNMVFWIEGDYFSGALSKPLLHTWSLAIEEQFYIFWALMIIGFRKSPKSVLPIIVTFALISLAAGFFLEERSPKTVFFLLPFRVWEFFYGILIYLMVRGRPFKTSLSPILPVANTAGVITIAATGVFFDESNSFPGFQSIIACCATAVIIISACFNQSTSRLLSMMPLRYLGKISYSLYLWHWPPLVFYFLVTGTAPSFFPATLLIAFSFVGAIASFNIIEQPIRKKLLLTSNTSFFKMIILSIITILGISLVMIYSKGLLFRYPEQIQPFFAASQERGWFRCGQGFVLKNPSSEFCKLTRAETSDSKAVLVLGDSHADVLKELLVDIADAEGVPLFLTTRNCDLGRFGSIAFCNDKIFAKIIAQAKQNGITDVIAISYWEVEKFNATTLSKDIKKLVDSGMRVHVVAAVPNDPTYDPRKRARNTLNGMQLDFSGISREKHEENSSAAQKIFDGAIDKYNPYVAFIDPAPYFCSSGECKWHQEGIPYYRDSNHLTFTGAEVLRPLFTQTIKSIKHPQ
jgi:peptidoglycan/LPS O-acetylase OafA/YrhL